MNEPVSKSPPSDDDVHLLDYLIFLAKYNRRLIFSALAVGALTYLILVFLPKYTATAQLLPPQQNLTLSAQLLESLGGSGFVSKESAYSSATNLATMLGLKTPGELYVGMLISNAIFDRIIERFQLRKLYDKKYIEDVRKKLGKMAEINLGRNGLISIEVTDENPQRAAEMANAFIEELDALLQKLARKEASERLAFLEKERTQANQRLAKAEEELRTFSEQSSVVQIDYQTKGMLEYISSLRAAVDSKEIQLQVLRQQATPFNYDLIRLETEIKGLKEKLRAAEEQESQTPTSGQSMIATSKVPALGLEYMRLYREAKFQEGLSQLYLKLVELARLDEVRVAAVVQIVDFARPPEKRSSQRLVPALAASIATFFIMIFILLIWEYCRGIPTREETARRLAILGDYLQPWSRSARRFFSVFKKSKK
jgi:tyrosine-protein kinase Etk/Wzc